MKNFQLTVEKRLLPFCVIEKLKASGRDKCGFERGYYILGMRILDFLHFSQSVARGEQSKAMDGEDGILLSMERTFAEIWGQVCNQR